MMLSHAFTYQEDLYRIKEPLTVIVPVSWDTLPENQKQLLSKILQAVNLDLHSVRIIRQAAPDFTEMSTKPVRIIGFVDPPKGVSKYEVYRTNQAAFLFADGLESLLEDQAAKRQLWTALQELFAG